MRSRKRHRGSPASIPRWPAASREAELKERRGQLQKAEKRVAALVDVLASGERSKLAPCQRGPEGGRGGSRPEAPGDDRNRTAGGAADSASEPCRGHRS